jgi:single-stranded DNA-binding protein
MNSFRLTAVGTLARNPELCVKGDITFARFCLVGQDSVTEGEPEGPRESVVTSLWFLAFSAIATKIARGARKGDQLILEARVVANHWTDKQGEAQHGSTFIVTGFRFGAKRGDNGPAAASRCARPPDTPPPDATEAEPPAVTPDTAEAAAGR